jgi:hypothetical protein
MVLLLVFPIVESMRYAKAVGNSIVANVPDRLSRCVTPRANASYVEVQPLMKGKEHSRRSPILTMLQVRPLPESVHYLAERSCNLVEPFLREDESAQR